VTHLKSIYFITPRFLLQIYRKSWREVGTGMNCSTSGPNGEDEAAGRLGICINNSLRWPMMLQEWIVRLIWTLCRKYDVLNDICNAEVYQHIISWRLLGAKKILNVKLNFFYS